MQHIDIDRRLVLSFARAVFITPLTRSYSKCDEKNLFQCNFHKKKLKSFVTILPIVLEIPRYGALLADCKNEKQWETKQKRF